jgi:hypothetical protein
MLGKIKAEEKNYKKNHVWQHFEEEKAKLTKKAKEAARFWEDTGERVHIGGRQAMA